MIRMIAAVSKNGVIGKNNTLPFHYKEDMKFFRKMTANSTVIMGRNTWESIGQPLPKRRNIVVTKNKLEVEGINTFPTLSSALHDAKENIVRDDMSDNIWLIGGSSIYREGMQYASEIYLTLIPDTVDGDGLVLFPWVNPVEFRIDDFISLEDSTLKVAKYVRV
jgi:dihydrofolate reductase